ncbi:hypothetical protein PR048_016197 [Dryococelus australis]|uniref:Double jelly roll-like domain-containing protein n=1 Tax=Dryococelus australis TaxID=614101 RepID=A0ABQ9HJ25_9NEOP|nr:hypothetical protein PR048_016197 [Dryococelus australis]
MKTIKMHLIVKLTLCGYNMNIANVEFLISYDMYTKFQEAYYNKNSSPNLHPKTFKSRGALLCLIRQHNYKLCVDSQIEIIANIPIPANIKAYALIIHDSLSIWFDLVNGCIEYENIKDICEHYLNNCEIYVGGVEQKQILKMVYNGKVIEENPKLMLTWAMMSDMGETDYDDSPPKSPVDIIQQCLRHRGLQRCLRHLVLQQHCSNEVFNDICSIEFCIYACDIDLNAFNSNAFYVNDFEIGISRFIISYQVRVRGQCFGKGENNLCVGGAGEGVVGLEKQRCRQFSRGPTILVLCQPSCCIVVTQNTSSLLSSPATWFVTQQQISQGAAAGRLALQSPSLQQPDFISLRTGLTSTSPPPPPRPFHKLGSTVCPACRGSCSSPSHIKVACTRRQVQRRCLLGIGVGANYKLCCGAGHQAFPPLFWTSSAIRFLCFIPFMVIGLNVSSTARSLETVQVAQGRYIGEGIGHGLFFVRDPSQYSSGVIWEIMENQNQNGRTGNRTWVLPNDSPGNPTTFLTRSQYVIKPPRAAIRTATCSGIDSYKPWTSSCGIACQVASTLVHSLPNSQATTGTPPSPTAFSFSRVISRSVCVLQPYTFPWKVDETVREDEQFTNGNVASELLTRNETLNAVREKRSHRSVTSIPILGIASFSPATPSLRAELQQQDVRREKNWLAARAGEVYREAYSPHELETLKHLDCQMPKRSSDLWVMGFVVPCVCMVIQDDAIYWIVVLIRVRMIVPMFHQLQ